MAKEKALQLNDADYAFSKVPLTARKGFGPMFVIMLGFTFFSASMWTGLSLAQGLDLSGFVWAVLLGGLFLGAYTGILGYIGCDTGLSFDLLCQRSFGSFGSYVPSAMIALTQIGWCGVGLAMFAFPAAGVVNPESPMWLVWLFVVLIGAGITCSAYFGVKGLEIVSWISVPLIAILGSYSMIKATVDGGGLEAIFAQSQGGLTIIGGIGLVIGSFVSGGTSTPNFVRFAKNNKIAVITTVIAFFIGNSLMFAFGGVSGAAANANDIFYVMIAQGLMIPAFIVLGANIWTTNDNGLYTGALGLSNITKVRKRPMVIVGGLLSIVLAVWLYNNFVGWLSFLNATLPPIGAIIMIDFFTHRDKYAKETVPLRKINWFAVAGVVAGALAGNFIKWGVAAINAMVIGGLVFYVGTKLFYKEEPKEA